MSPLSSALRLGLSCLLVCCSQERSEPRNGVVAPMTVEVLKPINSFPLRKIAEVSRPKSVDQAIQRALEHIRIQPDKRLSTSDISSEVINVTFDKKGNESVVLATKYRGLRVIGGDLIVKSAADGKLKEIEQNLKQEIRVETNDVFDPARAAEIAMKVFKGQLSETSTPELIVYAADGEPRPAYEVVLRGVDENKHPLEIYVIVDAKAGIVISQWDGICQGILSEKSWLASTGQTEATLSEYRNVVPSSPLLPLDQTFKLHSNPDSTKTVYLDFDGHTTTGTSWNDATMGSSFYSPAFSTDADRNSFSDSEKIAIQNAWQMIASDFAPFDVNVTTQAPPEDWLLRTSSDDQKYGIRVVITNFGPSSASAGGIAYISSFTRIESTNDLPCFVYMSSITGIVEAASHEVGHAFGLSHDGTFDGATNVNYYAGHGSGENGWAPIMGVGYYKSVTTWDNGVYFQSNNKGTNANYFRGADDIRIITNYNGFSFLTDFEGNTLDDAVPLTSLSSGAVSHFGMIQNSTDVDYFKMELSNNASVNLSFDPYIFSTYVDSDNSWGGTYSPYFAKVRDIDTNTANFAERGANLDLSVSLLDSSGSVLLTSSASTLSEVINRTGLAAGTYYLKLFGSGLGDPSVSSPSGYTHYGSIGNYLISGTISANTTPVTSISGSPGSISEDGTGTLELTFVRTVVTSDELTVNYTLSGTASPGVDFRVVNSGANQTISFAANSATAVLILDPTADALAESNETITLTLTSGSGYTLSNVNSVTATIIDDESSGMTFEAIADQSTAEDSAKVVSLGLSSRSGGLTCSTNVLSYTSSVGSVVADTGGVTWSGDWPNCIATINPVANASGSTSLTFRASDGTSSASRAFSFTVTPVNDAPTLGRVSSVNLIEDKSGVVQLPLADLDDQLSCTSAHLSYTATNIELISAAGGVTWSGDWPDCSATLTPIANASGSAVLTFGVSDGKLNAKSTFQLIVTAENDPPTIAALESQTIIEDTAGVVQLILGDIDHQLSCTSNHLSFVSSDFNRVASEGGVTWSGQWPNCSATINPVPDASGSTTVTFQVSDGMLMATSSFTLFITPVNDPPTISVIQPQSTSEDVAAVVSFKIEDVDTAVACTPSFLSYSSSQEVLVTRQDAVIFSGEKATPTAHNCSAFIMPNTNASGIGELTFSISDGVEKVSQNFTLDVKAENDSPTMSEIKQSQTVEMNTAKFIAFATDDIETQLSCTSKHLSYRATNSAVVTATNAVQWRGVWPNCVGVVTPVENALGESELTFVVSDGTLSNTQSFVLTVLPVEPNLSPRLLQDLKLLSGRSVDIPLSLSEFDTLSTASNNPLNCSSLLLVASESANVLSEAEVMVSGDFPRCKLRLNSRSGVEGNTRLTLGLKTSDEIVSQMSFVRVSVVSAEIKSSTIRNTAPLWVDFKGSSSQTVGGERIVSWDWDFGDDTQGNAENFAKLYALPGEYEVRLRVADDRGNEDLQKIIIIVED